MQAQSLADAGHVPDKVIMLDGPHALLLERVKYRRIDYSTGGWLRPVQLAKLPVHREKPAELLTMSSAMW